MNRIINVLILACMFWFGVPIALALLAHTLNIFGRMM